MKVEKLMKTDVAACHPDDRGVAAAEIMWDRDCGAVPVIDEETRVLGMVTDRDLCIAAYLRGTPLHDIPVEQVMSQELWSCAPQDEISDAETAMRAHQVRRLPVIDQDGRLQGILSLSDIALEAAREAKAKTKKIDVSYTNVAETLGDISVAHPRLRAATRAS